MEAIDNPAEESKDMLRNKRRDCFSCFCFHRFRSSIWVRANTNGEDGGNDHSFSSTYSSSWWRKGLGALMKIREWSELVAGPRWKTFIRRLNYNRNNPRNSRFHYDPLSYALNFDDGVDEDDDVDDAGYNGLRRGFSARFAVAPPVSLVDSGGQDA